MRGNGRSAGDEIFRRVASFPRNLLGGVSRAVGQTIDLIGAGPSRQDHHQHHHHSHLQTPPPPPPLGFPLPPLPPDLPAAAAATEEEEKWVFLDGFERQYGAVHPFFYACRFAEALRMAAEEGRLVFLYLHSPEHPFTAAFCRETLCSEVVVQFLDANFVSWGAVESRGEGPRVAATLRPASFPFSAVVAPAAGDCISVLRQIEGPVSPGELLEILQGTVEEQGLAFGSSRAREEEKRRADRRRLQEEQDAAYLAALSIDTEKERLKNLPLAEAVHRPVGAPNKPNDTNKLLGNSKQASTTNTRGSQKKEVAKKDHSPKDTRILVRFPNGERREQTFSCKDKIKSVYEYIDSLTLPGIQNYRLISSFPRRVFGVDQKGMTLKDAGLHPRGTLFLELL